MGKRFVIGVSGASGTILAMRVIDALIDCGHTTEVVVTRDAYLTANEELLDHYPSLNDHLKQKEELFPEQFCLHKINDFTATIASGSYPVDGMMIIPCSMATLAAVAMGLGDNLLRRAADVTLKERRRLVVVPREAPFSAIHLENMLKLTQMGSVIVPPIPGWYAKHETLADAEAFIAGRCLDALGIHTEIYPRWGVGSAELV